MLPLGLLAWLGARVALDERELLAKRFEELLQARLRDVDAHIQGLVDARARMLLELTALEDYRPQTLRSIVRTTPEIDQIFVQAPDGRILHPPVAGQISAAEQAFLVRTRRIFDDRRLLRPGHSSRPRPEHDLRQQSVPQPSATKASAYSE